jgi:hypothetical protein
MVEIKRTDDLHSPMADLNLDDTKYRLVYTKSKVYVNPTAYARDNIPGFVALVKRVRVSWAGGSKGCSQPPPQEAATPTYLLAWIPETLLNEKGSTEWDKFAKVEENSVLDEEDEGASALISWPDLG